MREHKRRDMNTFETSLIRDDYSDNLWGSYVCVVELMLIHLRIP